MAQRLLRRVPGGKVTEPEGVWFVDTAAVDLVGVHASHAEAPDAWRGAARATLDDAETRSFIVRLRRLLGPEAVSALDQPCTARKDGVSAPSTSARDSPWRSRALPRIST